MTLELPVRLAPSKEVCGGGATVLREFAVTVTTREASLPSTALKPVIQQVRGAVS
jgi:hypothetical protein